MEVLYRVSGLVKSYVGKRVLEIERLDIQRGEVLVLVGPSGAGKSTLLRLLNFLEYAEKGELLYKGQPVAANLPLGLRRQVTTVFQRPALLHDSVENNIAYGLRLRGLRENHAQILAMLERMGLGHLRHAQARTLSGGEAQRVALARALVIQPEVLLLDEPTANLDPYNIGLIEEVVRETNSNKGTSVVLVTHNIFQAKRLAKRVGLMLSGQLVDLSSCENFFNSGDSRTRAFVKGEMVY